MPDILRMPRIVWDEVPRVGDGVSLRQQAYERYKAQSEHYDTHPSEAELNELVGIIEREQQEADMKLCLESLTRANDELTGYAREIGEEQ
jgi:hypothetical protein